MLISPHELDLFYRLYSAILVFVNQRLKVIPENPSGLEDFLELPPQTRVKVRDALLAKLDLIESFVVENPEKLSADELDIVRSWSHLVHGRFYVLRELTRYTVFMSTAEPAVNYGVLALSQPFEDLTGPYLPVLTHTVLMPFRGKIIYDGLLARFNITFGPGTRRRLNEDSKAAKARYGIVTSLPMSLAAPPSLPPTKRK